MPIFPKEAEISTVQDPVTGRETAFIGTPEEAGEAATDQTPPATEAEATVVPTPTAIAPPPPPQPPSYSGPDPQTAAQLAALAAQNQQLQSYMASMNQAIFNPQPQAPPKPNWDWDKPDASVEEIAARKALEVVQAQYQQQIAPVIQHYQKQYMSQVQQAAFDNYNAVAAAKGDEFAQLKNEFDSTLKTLPLDTLAQKGIMEKVYNWVKLNRETAVTAPTQPAIAQQVPQVATKVSAKAPTSAKPGKGLSEEEVKVARKMGMTPEQYAKYK